MRSKRGRFAAAAAVGALGLALVVSACGGGGSSGSGGGTNSGGSTTATAGKTFGTLKVVWGKTDYMDPGLSYRLESWQLFQDVYEGLVGKQHSAGAASAKIIPVLAQSMPTVNKAGTDYKFTLRKGLHYSDGTPVKASDFKATIIRDFKLNSPGIGFFSNIVGSEACEKNPTSCSDISGIITNDSAGTVEIKLTQPESDFLYVLSLPFSSPVPASTPAKPESSPPPPASGPYYISAYSANKSFTIKRNPHYTKGSLPTVPQGNPNEVIGTITDDPEQSAQLVASGQYDYDENLLPSDRLAQLQKKYTSHIRFYTTPSTYYFFMNEKTPPFDNLKVRQAVNYAVDRTQLVKLRGGLGKVTENFLPPTYPQFKKINPYPYNLQKAKQLVQQSGTKGMKVTVWTISDQPVDKATGEYLQGVLKSLGYNTSIRELTGDNYFTIIGNQSSKAQIGFTDWFEDYPYPSDWFNILQNGDNITQVHNNNNSNVDIPSVNKTINQLDHLPPNQALSSATNAKWAALDNTLMTKYATEVPYLNGILTSFFSSRMDMSCDIFTDSQDDFAQFCLNK